MDDIASKFGSINIAVALACDGNRRKELNMVKRSKGFNWGAGAISNAFWKGALLADVLRAAGVDYPTNGSGKRRWVNFAGADQPSEGTYETCIPYEYAMDPVNDVLLAYEMNDVKLPPDHGYPLRVIIPGYVGGRQVKWLSKIWISEKENDSHYHIWDNRVLVRRMLVIGVHSFRADILSTALLCYRERWRLCRDALPSPRYSMQ